MSVAFRKYVSDKLINSLKRERLFNERLVPDIKASAKPQVFPAIRNNRIDFYHSGGKLFSYDGRGFTTNLKYAAVLKNARSLKTTIREQDLAQLRPIDDFTADYTSIKDLCELYARSEAKGVSTLYSRFSFAAGKDDYVVLDIEASFDASSTNEANENKQDRIDLVLLDQKERKLLFIEAKCYSNPAICASKDSLPPVIAQVKKYEKQVAAQHANIVSAYGSHVAAMKKLFDIKLECPMAVSRRVPLLIFDFDDSQEVTVKERQSRMIQNDVCCLRIGKMASAKSSTLAKWFKEAANNRLGQTWPC